MFLFLTLSMYFLVEQTCHNFLFGHYENILTEQSTKQPKHLTNEALAKSTIP